MTKNRQDGNDSNRATRRDFLKVSGGAALSVAGGPLAGGAMAGGSATRSKLKNILLIMTDQQFVDTIAAGGCPHVRTPAMDHLVRHGISFSQSHTPNPVCSPARSAIFTGRTSCETGVIKNGRGIQSTIPNLGQWFSQESDYETIYAGKWHVPKTFTHFIPGFRVINTGIGGQGNICDSSTSRACEGFIRSRGPGSRPYLMVASFLQPHDICEWLRINLRSVDRLRYPDLKDELPQLPPNFSFDSEEPDTVQRLRGSRDPAKGNWTQEHWRYYLWSYYRHVEMVDAEVGRILRALEESGQTEDTLVVFTSDHGEGMAQHQMVRKSFLYETGVKVPLILSWPGFVPENETDTEHLVSGLDIVPTLCDYAGLESPKNMRGKSLRTLLEDKNEPWHSYIVSESNSNTGRMVRTERYKYITYVDDPLEQLFDMREDSSEMSNLAKDSQHASTLADHRKLLRAWERRLVPAPNTPNVEAWGKEA